MKRHTVRWFYAVLFLTTGSTFAPAGTPLSVGDRAPALQPAQWVQGEPVKQFEKGKAYIVEFWATWCGPCRMSIPHLNEIYKKYKDKGLVVIGQNCRERNDSLVAPFVKNMGEKMTYRVALDNKRTSERGVMAETWMEAAGQNGIPTAFLVDGNGDIAWIGHPMMLQEDVVDQVLAGKFDLKAAAATYAAAERNKARVNILLTAASADMQKQDWDKALAKINEAEQLVPADERVDLEIMRYRILIGKKDYPAADKLAASLVPANETGSNMQTQLDLAKLQILFQTKQYVSANKLAAQISEAHKDDAGLQNNLAWMIAVDKRIEHRDLALAETIAIRANDASKGHAPQILDTFARVLFMEGKRAQAIETQKKAIDVASDEEKSMLGSTLASYQKGELPSAD